MALALLATLLHLPWAGGSAAASELDDEFARVGAVTLLEAEQRPASAVIGPDGDFAYYGTFTSPGRVVKIDLATFERVDVITLPTGEDQLTSAVIDPDGTYAYFGTFTSPGRVVKIDLIAFERVGAVTLPAGENQLTSAVIDPDGTYAYFGARTRIGAECEPLDILCVPPTPSSSVIQIDLDTLMRVGAIEGSAHEFALPWAIIDSAGEFAYFGAETLTGPPCGPVDFSCSPPQRAPARVVKISLDTFTRDSAITLATDQRHLAAAVIDPAGDFAYVGTETPGLLFCDFIFGCFRDPPSPARLVRVDLATFTTAGTLSMAAGEVVLASAVIDPRGDVAYFGTRTAPGRVVSVDLSTFSRTGAVTLAAGENELVSAVMDPAGGFAYFGTNTSPGRVVKVRVAAGLTVAASSVTVDEGSAAAMTGTARSLDGGPLTLSASVGTVTDVGDGSWSWTHTPADGPGDSQQVDIVATEADGRTSSVSFDLVVHNIGPTVLPATVNPGDAEPGVAREFTVSAEFSDPAGDADAPFTCVIDWGDGTSAGTVTGTVCALTETRAYSALGSYRVTVEVTDKDGGTGTSPLASTGTDQVTVADLTPPTVTVPADLTVEATGPTGASVGFADDVSAIDTVDGVVPFSCDPASGSTFPSGVTTVTCTATDAAGNEGSASFTVTVADTTAPALLDVPADVDGIEATGPEGATVEYAAPTATDIVDGAVPVSCAPTSGAPFGVGVTTVTCTATDAAGNEGSASFTVTVADTTAPALLDVPADVDGIEATGPEGATVEYAAPTATDIVDGAVPVHCAPASGSPFGLGATTVTCTASDTAGNTATASFTVTVVDTTPPMLTVPEGLTVGATGPEGASVDLTEQVSAADLVDGVVPVTCEPASGSLFPLGHTTVTCTAGDASGNLATAAFSLTVLGAAEQLTSLADQISEQATHRGTAAPLTNRVTKALRDLQAGRRDNACGELEKLIRDAERARGRHLTDELTDQLITTAGQLQAVVVCTAAHAAGAEEALTALQDSVQELDANPRIVDSLMRTLDRVARALSDDQLDKACRELDTFTREIERTRVKHLEDSEADALLTSAAPLADILVCT